MNWIKFTKHVLDSDKITIDKRILLVLGYEDEEDISSNKLYNYFINKGILLNDPRLTELKNDLGDKEKISKDDFIKIVNNNIQILTKIFNNDLVITDFNRFIADLKILWDKSGEITGGKVAGYIPQLARIDPNQGGISVCSIDGQRYSMGDSTVDFSVQSCCKPINYGIVLQELGSNLVHEYVGREPSGQSFNELLLNKAGLPHNPLINSGAIMTTSLIKNKNTPAERFEYIIKIWDDLSGNLYKIGFNNPVYLSEKSTADRNFALAYFMKEVNDLKKRGFPDNTDIHETLELYFQCCSIEVNCEIMSIVAATLANNGTNPLSGKRIWSSETVRNILSMMMTCGMYDYSGEFAFKIGLPAKSGVAGAIMIVIPNVMGICTWSPRLDSIGNSFRGIEFCKLFGEKFNFHIFDNSEEKSNILKSPYSSKKQYEFYELNLSASKGDLYHIKTLFTKGVNMNQCDYDGRTCLHLAVCENRIEVVKFLINEANIKLSKDRWNKTPYDDAIKEKNETIISLLKDKYQL